MSRIKENWRSYLREPRQRYEFAFACLVLLSIMLASIPYLTHIELRQGVHLRDPVFRFLPAFDLSGVIFLMVYAALITALVRLLPLPQQIVIGFETYALFVLLRMISMAVVPLEPPNGLIPLVDPILSFAYTGKPVNKDLFFSGHTGTMYLVYLMLPFGIYRRLAFVAVFVMAGCLVSQRVHYTVDVIVAPFFAYGALKLVTFLREVVGLPDETTGGAKS